MDIKYTTIKGTMLNHSGMPDEGVIITFRLVSLNPYLKSYEISTTANRLGRFEIKLPSTDNESDPESHYIVTVIQNNVRDYRVTVPSDPSIIRFDDLPEYKLPFERLPDLGIC